MGHIREMCNALKIGIRMARRTQYIKDLYPQYTWDISGTHTLRVLICKSAADTVNADLYLHSDTYVLH
jgi:hypothetical protein